MSENSYLIRALEASGHYDLAEKISACGKESVAFVELETEDVLHRPKMCKSKWCPICNKAIKHNIEERLQTAFSQYPIEEFRFITFTQRAYPGESLDSTAGRFEYNWQRLRRSKYWKSHVMGAIKKIEINRNHEGAWWHFHAHLVCHCKNVFANTLVKKWQNITGDSYEVTVDPIKHSTIPDMAKYFTKLQKFDRQTIGELVHWSKGKRFIEPYGDLRCKCEPDYDLDPDKHYKYLGTISQIWRRILEFRRTKELLIYAKYCLETESPFYTISENWRLILEDYVRGQDP